MVPSVFSGIRILSWNGQGMCLADSQARSRMGDFVRSLGQRREVLCFQEVHGMEAEILREFARWLPGWKISFSVSVSHDRMQAPGVGGLVTAISPRIVALAETIDFLTIIPGRVLHTWVVVAGRTLNILNIHNYGLSRLQVCRVGELLDDLRDSDANNPMHSFSIAIGDFNYMAKNERTFQVGKPLTCATPLPSTCSSTSRHNTWNTYLEKWVEIVQPMPTHFTSSSNSCTRIDRGFFACPGSLLLRLDVSSTVVGTPEGCDSKGLSDHAPVDIVICDKYNSPSSSCPSIPRWVCRHPEFGMHVQKIAEDIDLLSQPVAKRLPLLKKCIREAARCIRDRVIRSEDSSTDKCRLIADSMSRAVWFNDVCLAKKLLNSSSIPGEFISVNHGVVGVHSFPAFEDFFTSTKRKALREQVEQLSRNISSAPNENRKRQLKSRLQAARRLQTVFWSNGRMLKVLGVRVVGADGSERVLTSPAEVQEALKDHWEPVYSAQPIDLEAAERFLGVYANRNRGRFSFSDLSIPGQEEFEVVISKCHDSATGPDGIPYSAYKSIKVLAATVLADTVVCLVDPDSAEEICLEELNMQLVWFAPKGEEEADVRGVTRQPDNLRTIFGSNTDAKLISSAVAFVITPATLEATPQMQRGFCHGRQLAMNVVDLDAFMRAFNVLSKCTTPEGKISLLPCTVLYDFTNAFPTVSHEWLFLVLRWIGVPPKLIALIRVMYTKVSAFSSGLGDSTFLFLVLCGVITGAPASSLFFLLSINPFVDLFGYLSDGPGCSITRICADDFGSALASLRAIRVQASIFRLAKKVTGLHLKPSKCVIIVSCMPLSDFLVGRIRAWLHAHVPEFADFSIQSSGKYLGYILGVDSCKKSYVAPLKKFRDRILEVSSGNAPSTVAIVRYNQRAVTVLSYVAQFSHPPCAKSVRELSHNAVHKILHMPPKCMSRQLSHTISLFSAVDPLPLWEYCLAILFRFASSERSALLELREAIHTLLGDHLTVDYVINGGIPRGGCNDSAILQNLLWALDFRGPYEDLGKLAHRSLSHSWLLDFPSSSLPPGIKSLQSGVLFSFRSFFQCADLGHALTNKAVKTLGVEESCRIRVNAEWFLRVRPILDNCKYYLRMCWLKAICGAWCTTYRMHEEIKWPCIFGCTDSRDDIGHYLLCPILWQFASEHIGCIPSVFLEARLCLVNPCIESVRALAFVHTLYHCCKNDLECKLHDGRICGPRIVQNRAAQFSRHVKHLI